ncbi:hypothetical protein CMI37_34100 [Candidatus Pacearchaeota archaeon]|nr:hypothetical protein [Candidatus Pacearchaeota archaeon]|tara:strand:+ start:1362 stop:1637 length:276 start_codon:yes stop_codon:yes gene_type:complete
MVALLNKIPEGSIENKPLRELVATLREGEAAGIDPLRMTPDSAQQFQSAKKGPKPSPKKHPQHTDHTDYGEHTDTAPKYSDHVSPHSDYCD